MRRFSHSGSYKGPIPGDLPSTLLPLLIQYLGTNDISLLSHSFTVLTIFLELVPDTSYRYIESQLLPDIYRLSLSPLISGASLDSLLAFYESLVRADQQIVTRVVPSLVLQVEKSTKGTIATGHAAKCIAKVVQSNLTVAAGTTAEFTRMLKVNLTST